MSTHLSGSGMPEAMTVSQITGLIKEILESGFRRISVEGEISNFRPASSGHIYFSLKDPDAMISCALFRSNAQKLSFSPKDGQKVRVRGDISVYPKRGNYQIIVTGMSLAGEGAILQMLEERKRILAAEGLFAEERKRRLPFNPKTIAVVTSPTGAAIRDILQVLHRRHAGVAVRILPAAVQGDGAAEQIVRQIRTANLHSLGEVLIIGRGGGSLEDLLPFSEESVVRAVAESQIPVISAVGHEIDWALSDFAADLRAPTPSAAAELVSASRDELTNRLKNALRYLTAGIQSRTRQISLVLERFSAESMERTLRQKLQPLLIRLDDEKEELCTAMGNRLREYRHRLTLAEEKLKAGNPEAILSRGYSVVTMNNRVLTDSTNAHPQDRIDIRLFKGRLAARVESSE